MHHTVKDVTAHVVGAKPVFAAGHCKLVVEILIVVALGRDEIGAQRHGHKQNQADQAGQRDFIFAKATPDLLELALAHIGVVLGAVFLHLRGAGLEDMLLERNCTIH